MAFSPAPFLQTGQQQPQVIVVQQPPPPPQNKKLNLAVIKAQLVAHGFTPNDANSILSEIKNNTAVNSVNRLIKIKAGLTYPGFKSTITKNFLPYANRPNKHALRFRLSKLINEAGLKPNNFQNVNLTKLSVTGSNGNIKQQLKNLIGEAKSKKTKGLRKNENLGAGVIYDPNTPGENKYFYVDETGRRYKVTQNFGLGKRWSATIGTGKGGIRGLLTNKKILFNYSVSSNGKPRFTRVKNSSNSKMNTAQPAAAAAAVPGGTENYSSMNTFKLLEKYKNARNKERREAIEKVINSKLEQTISNLKYKNVSYRITQYSKILRALHTRPNFPGRSIIVGSIRNDIRKAAASRNAKYELERIRRNLDISALPLRDRNIKETFNYELKVLKDRERRYENAYGGGRRNRGFNMGPPPRGFNMGPPPPRGFNMGPPPPRGFNTGPPPPRGFNMGPAPNRNAGAPLVQVAQPKFNITGAPPPNIKLPPVNLGTPAAPAPAAPNALPVNLPANEAAAIKQVGGVNAAANKINQAGGATNVAKTANALQKANGNTTRAVQEFGANPQAVELVIKIAGQNKNFNKVNDMLNGMEKVAKKIRRKRRTAPAKKRAAPAKKRAAPAKKRAAPAKKRAAPAKKRAAPVRGRVVRTGELNKLLHAVTRNTIERRINNANVIEKTRSKNELINIYKNFLLGVNLKKRSVVPPSKRLAKRRSKAAKR